MSLVYPATTNDQAISLNIDNANKFHDVVNGNINTTVSTYEGNGDIPSVAKALHDAAAYKAPIAWEDGETETDLLQPRIFGQNVYVPLTVPADMLSSPDGSWRLYSIDGADAEDSTRPKVDGDEITSTSYTYKLDDEDNLRKHNTTNDVTCIVPHDDNIDFPLGATIPGKQVGGGRVSWQGESMNGTTVQVDYAQGRERTRAPGSPYLLLKEGPNHWVVWGDLA